MSNPNSSDDLRPTRLYELLLHLKPKQRKIVQQTAQIKEVPIDTPKVIILNHIIEHIQKRSKQPLSKALIMKKSGFESNTTFNYATSDLFKMICKMLYLTNTLKDNAPSHLFLLANFFIHQDLPINDGRYKRS